MYRNAMTSVFFLHILSDGIFGTVCLSLLNASFSSCVRCRSLLLACCRCFCMLFLFNIVHKKCKVFASSPEALLRTVQRASAASIEPLTRVWTHLRDCK